MLWDIRSEPWLASIRQSITERVNSLLLLGPIAAPSQNVRVGLLERARNVPMNGDGSRCRHFSSDPAIDSNHGHQSESRCLPAREHNAAGYARTYEALAGAIRVDVDQIQCRALLITADEDQTAPPQKSRLLARAVARSRLILLTRVAHMTPLKRPRG
jgi:3-oxoadipate enol-lactonase